ncbi:MAG: lyase, partial [Gemmatimonadota bacterium]|nr:lyase [Gemmatimonadota bacterium]
MKHFFSAVVIAALFQPGSLSAAVQDTIQIDEWEVPFENSRPRDPYVAPDGQVWFVGQRSHYAAVLDPGTGEFTRFDLDEGTGPHNLVVDDDGIVWYTGNLQRHIGRLDPVSGEIQKFMMPDERARDPHTLVFDSQGDMWFSVQGGNFIGKFDRETGQIDLVEAPVVTGGRRGNSSRPYGIKIDADDRPWVALLGTNLIATVDPLTMELSTFALPEGARPRRLEIASDGTIWYVDYSRGFLGHLDPATGDV